MYPNQPNTQESFEDLNARMDNPQVIFSWKAPLRAYKKTGKKVLRFYLALALLLSLIVFFFGDRILVIPIWSLLFLFYTLTITPPPEVENKITKFGIETVGVTLRWEVLAEFYFTKRFNMDMLTVVSHGPYFYHAYMIIPNDYVKRKVMQLLVDHLVYQEKPQRSITDRLVDLFSHLVPEDEDSDETNGENKDDKNHTPIDFSALHQKHQASSL